MQCKRHSAEAELGSDGWRVLQVYAPQFLLSSLDQSSVVAGETNTLTVSLRTNFQMSFGVNKISLVGLVGSVSSGGDITLKQALNKFFFTVASAKFDNSAGTLTINPLGAQECVLPTDNTKASTCIHPGTIYVFEFQVTNPASPRPAVLVTIESSYYNSATQQISTTAPQIVAQKSQAAQGVSPPSQVILPAAGIISRAEGMRTVQIGQTNPNPGQRNAICVTLRSFVDIKTVGSSTAAFTITGLPTFTGNDQLVYAELRLRDGLNPITNQSNLDKIFSATDERPATKANHATVQGNVIKFYVIGTGLDTNGQTLAPPDFMRKDTDYSFCVMVRNLATPTSCGTPRLTVANGGDTSQFTMTVRDTRLTDYGLGWVCPGRVASKTFLRANIRQHSNATGMQSQFFVEMLLNADIERGASVTISGLRGYNTQSSTSLPIRYAKNGAADTAETWGTKATWSQTLGSIVLAVKADGEVKANDPYSDPVTVGDQFEFTFMLTNGAMEQDAVPVS